MKGSVTRQEQKPVVLGLHNPDPTLLVGDSLTEIVQVEGKERDRLEVAPLLVNIATKGQRTNKVPEAAAHDRRGYLAFGHEFGSDS